MNALAATNENSIINDYGTREFVTVEVGGQSIGVGVKEIHDVFEIKDLTPVPGSSQAIAGVLNLRGRIVTAIDARVMLGLPAKTDGYNNTMAIGIEKDGESYGILVDKVGEVLRLKDSDFEANPMNMDNNWKALSRGIYRLNGKLLMAIDIERFLEI